MELKENMPNISGDTVTVADCPHCSMAHQIRDEKNKPIGLPDNCTRCGCPLKDEGDARAFSDLAAEKGDDAAVTTFGNRMRGVAEREPVAVAE